VNHEPTMIPTASRHQRGATTLAVTMILLVVITAMVLFSASVGYFEQRTTTNQNRAQIAQKAAEYALGLAGEYMKANRGRLISNDVAGGGWFAAGTLHWAKCADVGTVDAAALDSEFPAGHPCLSERDTTRRAQLYFWTTDGLTSGSRALPYTAVIPAGAQVEAGLGGNADFTASTTVGALLCRLDTSDLSNVQCKLEPVAGNRVALTLVAQAALSGEGAGAEVKEAWATYNSFVPSAAVPLVASGLVKGLGNAQIVAAPNAGGYGLPGSIWTPQDADVDSNGSVTTCHIGDYLKGTPETELKTTCATTDDCSCNGGSSSEFLSGHIGPLKREAEDIIDVDAGPPTIGVLPNITFFPGKSAAGTEMDKGDDPTDDSLFEFTFNVDYEAAEDNVGITLATCGDGSDENCVAYAMNEEFDATPLASCSDLGTSSSGIIYIASGCSDIPNNVGTADNPAIVVLHQASGQVLNLNSDVLFYGMLFVHSDDNTAQVKGNGSIKIFGALVVEGDVEISGNITVVYDDTSVSGDTHKLPTSARFGRVAGSWLDSGQAF
jgi:Tfp pilus assembly protein PilX